MDQRYGQTKTDTLPARAANAETALACLLLFGGALLVRLINLGAPPEFDELYTMLAAKGWVAWGEPRIAEGVYDRAKLYTIIVAGFIAWLGESVSVARLPSVIAGSLLVVAVFLWTRAVAANLAAWIAAAFVALDPIALQVSQFARFYALQGLVFWMAAIGVYYLWAKRLDRWLVVPVAIACGLGFLFALHLQILTAIGLVGIALWLVVVVGLPELFSLRARPLAFWGILGALLLLVAATLAASAFSGVLGMLIDEYRYTPLHAVPVRNQVWFYHLALNELYPSLWPLFPVAVLLAIATRPHVALFCLSVFLPGFILLSFGGMKQAKYLCFLLPFLFVIWAIALARLAVLLGEAVVWVTDRALQVVAPDFPRLLPRYALIAGCIVFLALSNGAPARILLLPFGIQLTPEGAPVDWAAARETLEPWVNSASIVLTNEELALFYYFGRFDVTVSSSRLSELDERHEFSRDNRTGRPVVSTAESVARIMACYPNGVVLSTTRKWRNPAQLDSKVADLIERHAEPIEVPKQSRIVAFAWGQTEIDLPPDTCMQLSALRAPG